jgi:hypothetical protein
MAKNSNGTTRKILFAILVAGFAISIAAVVWDASHKSSSIEINRKDIDVLIPKVEMIKESSQEYRYKIDTLETKMNELNLEQKALRRDQQTGFDKILDRLPE